MPSDPALSNLLRKLLDEDAPPPDPTISVIGLGEATQQPVRLRAGLTIRVEPSRRGGRADEADRIATRVVAQLIEGGLQEEELSAGQLDLGLRFRRKLLGGVERDAAAAERRLVIDCPDLQRLTAGLMRLAELEAEPGTTVDLDHLTPIYEGSVEDRTHEAAAQDAVRNAEAIARGLGVALGPIRETSLHTTTDATPGFAPRRESLVGEFTETQIDTLSDLDLGSAVTHVESLPVHGRRVRTTCRVRFAIA